MKKLVILLVVAGAAYLGYRFFIGKSAAYQTYEKFAEALAWGRTEEALQYADESVLEDMGDAEHRAVAGDMPVEHIHATDYQIESETKSADGNVNLRVKQILYFDPPGVTSAIGGAVAAIFRQNAVLQKTGGTWKVIEFDSEFIETKETRK